jgi:hypothetical protein
MTLLLSSGELASAPARMEAQEMSDSKKPIYTSRIIKAGALLGDTKTLLANWDNSRSILENLERFKGENLFGKTSRSRIEDVLAIFRQRYLQEPSVVRALHELVNNRIPSDALNSILFFHSAQSDRLLHDVVTEILWDYYVRGKSEIRPSELEVALTRWVREGKTSVRWQAYTTRRVAQGLLATLRDFGLLQGKVNKRLAPMHLPTEAFAYVAFYLHQRQRSGERLIEHPEWRLFFLQTQAVERQFMEAHQRRLLEYHAAGPVIRIGFPTESLEDYTSAISQRPI